MNEIIEMIYQWHQGAGFKSIRRSLGFDRKTIRKYVELAQLIEKQFIYRTVSLIIKPPNSFLSPLLKSPSIPPYKGDDNKLSPLAKGSRRKFCQNILTRLELNNHY